MSYLELLKLASPEAVVVLTALVVAFCQSRCETRSGGLRVLLQRWEL